MDRICKLLTDTSHAVLTLLTLNREGASTVLAYSNCPSLYERNCMYSACTRCSRSWRLPPQYRTRQSALDTTLIHSNSHPEPLDIRGRGRAPTTKVQLWSLLFLLFPRLHLRPRRAPHPFRIKSTTCRRVRE